MHRVIFIGDNPILSHWVNEKISQSQADLIVQLANSEKEAIEKLAKNSYDYICLCYEGYGEQQLKLLQAFQKHAPDTPVITLPAENFEDAGRALDRILGRTREREQVSNYRSLFHTDRDS